MASLIPWAVAGCLKCPASPTSAQPGPAAGRKNPRSMVSGTTRRSLIISPPSSVAAVEDVRKVPDRLVVAPAAGLGVAAREVGRAEGEQQVDVVLARDAVDAPGLARRHRHPLDRLDSAPVREQHRHVRGAWLALRQVEHPGDARGAPVGAEDPLRLDPRPVVELDAADRVVLAARAESGPSRGCRTGSRRRRPWPPRRAPCREPPAAGTACGPSRRSPRTSPRARVPRIETWCTTGLSVCSARMRSRTSSSSSRAIVFGKMAWVESVSLPSSSRSRTRTLRPSLARPSARVEPAQRAPTTIAS